MASASHSNSQCLRVIGQELERLGVESFEAEKRGEEYIVRMEHREPAEKKFSGIRFLQRITKIIRGSADPAKEISGPGEVAEPLRFSSSDINWLDSYGRSRRGAAAPVMPDVQKISLGLRVIGDYLDRKRASTFAIWWSNPSVISVNYKTSENDLKRENFSAQNLYDLGVHMYLRRSNRFPAV
jgi:hypothetical protein